MAAAMPEYSPSADGGAVIAGKRLAGSRSAGSCVPPACAWSTKSTTSPARPLTASPRFTHVRPLLTSRAYASDGSMQRPCHPKCLSRESVLEMRSPSAAPSSTK